MDCKIFVSHAKEDEKIVTPIVDNILRTFEINEKEIMYTSSLTSGLRNGTDFNDEIREAIRQAKLVIVYLSHNYLKSIYCLIELGATWGMQKDYFIYKAPEVSDYKIIPTFCTLVQDDLNEDGIVKLHNKLEKDVGLKKVMTDFAALFSDIKKTISLIGENVSEDVGEKLQTDIKSEGKNEELKSIHLSEVKEKAAILSTQISEQIVNLQFERRIGNFYLTREKTFSLIVNLFNSVLYYVSMYADGALEITNLPSQPVKQYGPFNEAIMLIKRNMKRIDSWHASYMRAVNDMEYFKSKHEECKEEVDKYLSKYDANVKICSLLCNCSEKNIKETSKRIAALIHNCPEKHIEMLLCAICANGPNEFISRIEKCRSTF